MGAHTNRHDPVRACIPGQFRMLNEEEWVCRDSQSTRELLDIVAAFRCFLHA